jgi:bacterioferritin
MIREDLVAERIAVESYSEIIRYLGDNAPTSKQMMEEILAKEEDYADDMKTPLERVGNEEVTAKVKPKSSGGRHRRGS